MTDRLPVQFRWMFDNVFALDLSETWSGSPSEGGFYSGSGK